MNYELVYSIAEADCDSRWYGSAAQVLAEDIAGLIVQRSWCEDDAQLEGLTDYIESQVVKLQKLVTNRIK